MAARTRSSAAVAALLACSGTLGGCALLARVGVIDDGRADSAQHDGQFDATDAGLDAPDASLDGSDADADGSAAVDAPADGSPDADAGPPPVSERRLRGLEPEGSGTAILNWDSVDPDAYFRLYYVGRDGDLRVERRRASDHGRECVANLGHPPRRSIAGNLAVAATHDLVVVPTTPAGGGVAEYWAREIVGSTNPSACAFTITDWEQLPGLPMSQPFGSAPSATKLAHYDAAYVATTDVSESRVHLLTREPAAVVWVGTRWITSPSLRAGYRIVSQPVADHFWDYTDIWVVTEDRAGVRAFAFITWDDTHNFFPGSIWNELALPAGEPPATVPTVCESFDQSTGPIRWVAYVSQSGHAWVTSIHADSRGLSPWTDLGLVAPAADPDGMTPLVLSPPSMGYRRAWREFNRDLTIVDVVWDGTARMLVHMDMNPATGAWELSPSVWPSAGALE